MTSYIRHPLIYVWLFLSAVTLISWRLGAVSHAASAHENMPVSAAVLLIAAVKTRFVIRHYMEVRSAPTWLKRGCDAWLLGLFAMIASFYWCGL
jgi:hypothetical protein